MVYGKKERKIQKRYREKHREELRERGRQRYKENPDFFREKTRKWRKRNYKKWIKKNRKKEQRRLKKWSSLNKEKIIKIQQILYWKYKFLALQKISGQRIPKCIKCGEKDIRILTINHIDGISIKEKKIAKHHLYLLIKNGKRNISDLEIRCYCCNYLFEYERGKLKGIGKRRKKALNVISKGKKPNCKKCGKTDMRILNINHINGVGNNRKKPKYKFYEEIIKKGRNGYDIRCFNCNILYEFEKGRYFCNKKALEKTLKEKGIIHISDKIK